MIAHLTLCPFNWSSEYYDPLKRLDYAFALATRALLRSSDADWQRCKALYSEETGAVLNRMDATLTGAQRDLVRAQLG